MRHKPHRPYGDDELRAILRATGNDPTRAIRDRAILLLFIGGGLRLAEVAAVKAEDINWGEGVIMVRGKGNKERMIAPGPAVIEALRVYLNRGRPPIWGIDAPAIGAMVKRRAREAGLMGIHPHGFRHTLAIRLLESSRDLDGLRIILGHETLKQAAEYAAYTAQERALEEQRRLNLADRL